MLVLTRKQGESLYIDGNIKVVVHSIKGNQVRIGVDAPSNVKIYREEIYLQILEENKSAADLSSKQNTDLSGVADIWKQQKPKGIAKLSKSKEEKDQDES